MAISKSNFKKNKYKLSRKFQKNGLSCWRYYFKGKGVETGKEASFFLELYVVNPLISPNQIMLSQKSRPKISEDDLQSALAGHDVSESNFEEVVLPSFVAIRGGIYGDERKQINNFYSTNNLISDRSKFNISVQDNIFSDDLLSGSISCSKSDVTKFPEYNSNVGTFKWNLNYERLNDFDENCSDNFHWMTTGVNCSFSGRVILDSEEYTISPKFCCGYSDKLWGSSIFVPFFHLGSNRLTSVFNGEVLDNSGFAICGVDKNNLSFLCRVQSEEYIFPLNKKNYTVVYNCIPVPGEEDNERIHWSLSLNSKMFVCDVDVFCSAKEMIVREYELPSGNKKVLKILSGFTGNGELKIYKKIKKNLDLIHQSKIENCICEFGNIE